MLLRVNLGCNEHVNLGSQQGLKNSSFDSELVTIVVAAVEEAPIVTGVKWR